MSQIATRNAPKAMVAAREMPFHANSFLVVLSIKQYDICKKPAQISAAWNGQGILAHTSTILVRLMALVSAAERHETQSSSILLRQAPANNGMAGRIGPLLECPPLRKLHVPFSASHQHATLGVRHAATRGSRPSLLTRRVQQAEREAPAVPVPPPQPSSPSPESSHSTSTDAPQSQQLEHNSASSPTHADTSQQPSEQPPLRNTTDASARLPPRRQLGGPDMPAPQRGSPNGPRPPFPFQRPGAAAILATYGAYIGALGTLAVGTAWATDINLAAMFRWSPDVVETALMALVPLAALNTLIMLPDYSTWALPKLDGKGDPEEAALLQQTLQPSAADAVRPSAAASSSSAGAAGVSQAAGAREGLSAKGIEAKPGMVPASAWGQKKPLSRILKDAMHLAQGHYTANNPTVDVNPAVELATTTAQALAAEMLYRGVAITLLREWLEDRFYEAGADDVLTVPFSSTPIDTHDAAFWAAAWLLVALSFGLALRKVFAAPRPRIVSMVDLRQNARRQGGQQAGAEGASPPPSPSSSTPLSDKAGAPRLDGPLRPRAPVPGWVPQGFQQVTTLAAVIQGTRNVTQTLLFNCLFVASGGNLAATFTASLANQLLFSVLQRQSMERMQKRSSALAKELEVLNKRLMDIQRKKAARANASSAAAPATTDASVAGSATQDVAAGSAASASLSVEGGASAEGLVMTADQGGLQGDQLAAVSESQAVTNEGEALLHAAVATAAAASAVDAPGAVVATAAAGAGVGPAGASGSSGVPTSSQLSRALMALDMLLPPEQAKGKSDPAGKAQQKE